jgi:hypothetical protein
MPHRLLVALLAVSLLHTGVLPVRAEIDVTFAARWPSRLERLLDRLENDARIQVWLRLETLEGARFKARFQGLERMPEADYAQVLEAWSRRDPVRLALPALNGSLVVENHFEGGRALRGTFQGFDGPFHLLAGGTQPDAPRALPLDGLLLSGPTGRLILSRRDLDRTGDWPPSRSLLLLLDNSNEGRRLPLDSLARATTLGEGGQGDGYGFWGRVLGMRRMAASRGGGREA